MTGPTIAVESAPSLASTDAGIWDAPAESGSPPDAAPPASEAATAAPATRPRDDQGRFASDQAPPIAAPVPPDPASPPAESTDEQTPPADGAQPEPAEVYPEFEYAVNGRALNIPGSKVGEEGLFIPTPQVEQTSRLLIAGRMAEQQARNHGRELQAAVKAARSEGQAEVQHAQKVMAAVGALMKDPAALAKFSEDLTRNWDRLVLEQKVKVLEEERTSLTTQQSEAQNTAQAEALVPQLRGAVQRYVGQFATKPEYAGVDTAKLQERLLTRHFDQVFSEDENGQVLVDQGFIESEMEYEAGLIARGRQEATRLSATKQENATRQGQGVKPPPMVGTGKGSQTAGTKPKTYKSTREADSDIWG